MPKKKLDFSYFNTKSILITGANGYIGSSVVRLLSKTSARLILFTKKNGNITDKNIWKRILKGVDIVFHFAAQTSSTYSNKYPVEDLAINVVPVINLIDTCRNYGYSPHIIYAGTVTQIGYTSGGKINETCRDQPITIYDINKLAAEKFLQYYSMQLSGRAVTLRLANIYGPGPQNMRPDRGIVNKMILKALKKEPITILGTGKYIRDYIYIDDAIDAFLRSAINIKKTSGKYYVLGTGTRHTILDMANIIVSTVKAITGTEIDIIFKPFPEGTSLIEFRNFTADSGSFQKDSAWLPHTSLKEGIKKTVEYFIKQK